MSKMDRKSNQNTDKRSIYEIFTSCRLCGAGGGYKIPIIQNIVDMDADVELKQKIRECVQIEVHQDDKMPPLICELCIDKTNDFYEFLRMCQETNKTTRSRLGLPQTLTPDVSESSDCILGVTEKVYSCSSDDDNAPLFPKNKKKTGEKKKEDKKATKSSSDKDKGSVKRLSHKVENIPPKNNIKKNKELVGLMQPIVPLKRLTRINDSYSEEEEVRTTRSKKITTPEYEPKKSILKKETTKEPESDKKKPTESDSLRSNKKRSCNVESPKTVPAKKVKMAIPPPAPEALCDICNASFPSLKSVYNHMRAHIVTYTNERLACNCCGEWFPNPAEANAHHKKHKYYYNCDKCMETYTSYNSFKEHFEEKPCELFDEVPDKKCHECWKLFPTENLLEQHKCPGTDGRLGGKCFKCKKYYALMKNLRKHEAGCSKSFEIKIDPEIKKVLQNLQIKMARCDSVLAETRNGDHYDVSSIIPLYDLDTFSYYPYKYGMRLKTEYQDNMVNIHYDALDYVHWDSDVSTDAEDSIGPKKVDKLSTIALKVIYSNKFLGKMPRKRRKFFKAEDLIARFSGGKMSIDGIDKGFKEWDDDADVNSDMRNVGSDISKIVDSLGEDLDDDTQGNDSPNIFSSLKNSGDCSVGNVFGDVDIDSDDKTDNLSVNESNKSCEVEHSSSNIENNDGKKNSDMTSIDENKDHVIDKVIDSQDGNNDDGKIQTNDIKEGKESKIFSISSLIANNESDKLSSYDNDNKVSNVPNSESQSSSKVDDNADDDQNIRTHNDVVDKNDDDQTESSNNHDNSTTIINGNDNDTVIINNKSVNEKSAINNDKVSLIKNDDSESSDKELMKALDEQIGDS